MNPFCAVNSLGITHSCLTFEKNINMNIEIGQEAPDFSLFNTEKNKVSLSDHRGKNVVLLFFPLAFSGTCTKEVCTMRDTMALYNGLNAEIIGISIDSLFVLGQFKKDNALEFELLSDFNKEVAELYGCLNETFVYEMRGVAKRSSFILDKDGIVKYKEILESAGDLPNFEAIQECLQTLN